MMAQLTDPRDRLSITATVDGATNTDYRWKTEKGQLLEDGRLQQGVNARVRANVKLVGDQPTDPAAIHELRRMQVICDGLAEQLEATKAENEELKKQYESAEMSLLNTREQRADDMERFRISETNKMNLETAKLESQNAKAAAELAIKNKAVNADMQMAATEAEQAAVDKAEKIAGGENAV